MHIVVIGFSPCFDASAAFLEVSSNRTTDVEDTRLSSQYLEKEGRHFSDQKKLGHVPEISTRFIARDEASVVMQTVLSD